MEAPLWILILYSGVGAIDILYNPFIAIDCTRTPPVLLNM
jgi:hypothetical protein